MKMLLSVKYVILMLKRSFTCANYNEATSSVIVIKSKAPCTPLPVEIRTETLEAGYSPIRTRGKQNNR